MRDSVRGRGRDGGREARGASRACTAAQTHTALTHARTCAATLKLFASSRVLALRSFVCFRPLLQNLTVTSPQDVLFNLAVEKLPKPLASAMVKNGFINLAVLSYHPRKTAEELGLAPGQESKVRRVSESVGVACTTAVGHGAFSGSIGSMIREAASSTEFDAALILHERSEELRHKRRDEKTVADELVQAATVRPRNYRARYLRSQFQGPSARNDAEDSERNRWTELADFLRGAQSPMGQFLASQPGN